MLTRAPTTIPRLRFGRCARIPPRTPSEEGYRDLLLVSRATRAPGGIAESFRGRGPVGQRVIRAALPVVVVGGSIGIRIIIGPVARPVFSNNTKLATSAGWFQFLTRSSSDSCWCSEHRCRSLGRSSGCPVWMRQHGLLDRKSKGRVGRKYLAVGPGGLVLVAAVRHLDGFRYEKICGFCGVGDGLGEKRSEWRFVGRWKSGNVIKSWLVC